MSCFKLPNKLCDELTGIVRQFWWGQLKDEKKLAWMSWGKMCLPKERGGMGFRDLKTFNLALLAKQGWRLQANSSSLFSRVYKAKYFPRCDFVDAGLGSQPSYAWRSIHAAQALVRRGMRWQVGNGEHIRILRDKWLPTPKTYKVVTPERETTPVTMVCDLIDNESKEWKVDVVHQNILSQVVEAILSIPLSVNGARDKIVWAENKNGKFSVRSVYKVAMEDGLNGEMAGCLRSSEIRKVWRGLWGMNVPNK
ncbi:putative mitochondrial protein AtMg00310 [Castanea sativa]|uniref:putative mitochondrial protein AtMg00310 n=1 Tax=Castanea sativa TaxID=21020 RepID=UPI003F64943A